MSTQFPLLVALLDNPEINKEFEAPEDVANRAKFLFNTFGLTSLIFIVLVLLIITWRFFLHTVGIITPIYLLWISAVLGFLSFAILLASHFIFKLPEKWLHNRFVAERLRQWKYQQLLDGEFVGLSQTDPPKFKKELEGRWEKAKFDVLEIAGTVNDFLAAEDFRLFVTPSVCRNNEAARQIFESYQSLRLDYQAKYFSFKKETLGTLDVWTNGLAKFFLLVGGALAVGEVVSVLAHTGEHESTLSWVLGASALSAALISAAIRVVRSAKAISEETEKCTSKWVQLKILSERFRNETDAAKRLECMVDTERVSVEELRGFIRTFSKADYLF